MIRQHISLEIRGKRKGYIDYTDEQDAPRVSFEVSLPWFPAEKQRVIHYLNKRRSYEIPLSSDDTDQYETRVRKPTSHISYFQLALSELGISTGVFLSK